MVSGDILSWNYDLVLTSSFSVLCSDMAVKQIDEPFVTASESRDEWAL